MEENTHWAVEQNSRPGNIPAPSCAHTHMQDFDIFKRYDGITEERKNISIN